MDLTERVVSPPGAGYGHNLLDLPSEGTNAVLALYCGGSSHRHSRNRCSLRIARLPDSWTGLSYVITVRIIIASVFES